MPPFERGLTLGDFLVPIRVGERAALWQRNLLMITVGTLLIILGARISFYLPGNPIVPVTLQTFGVLFGGALLGCGRSLATRGPVSRPRHRRLAGVCARRLDRVYRSGHGHDHLRSAAERSSSARPAATHRLPARGGLVGRLAELGWDRHIGGSLGAMILGNVAIYAVGVPWLTAATGQTCVGARQRRHGRS